MFVYLFCINKHKQLGTNSQEQQQLGGLARIKHIMITSIMPRQLKPKREYLVHNARTLLSQTQTSFEKYSLSPSCPECIERCQFMQAPSSGYP